MLAEKNLANAASRRPPAKMLSGRWASAIPWLMFGKNIPRHALKESEMGVQREIVLLGNQLFENYYVQRSYSHPLHVWISLDTWAWGEREMPLPTLFFHPPFPLSLRFPIRTPSRECYSFSLVEGPTVKTRAVWGQRCMKKQDFVLSPLDEKLCNLKWMFSNLMTF